MILKQTIKFIIIDMNEEVHITFRTGYDSPSKSVIIFDDDLITEPFNSFMDGLNYVYHKYRDILDKSTIKFRHISL